MIRAFNDAELLAEPNPPCTLAACPHRWSLRGLSAPLHDQATQLQKLLIGAAAADEGEPKGTAFQRRQWQADLR